MAKRYLRSEISDSRFLRPGYIGGTGSKVVWAKEDVDLRPPSPGGVIGPVARRQPTAYGGLCAEVGTHRVDQGGES